MYMLGRNDNENVINILKTDIEWKHNILCVYL